jgi:hypothetical protein
MFRLTIETAQEPHHLVVCVVPVDDRCPATSYHGTAAFKRMAIGDISTEFQHVRQTRLARARTAQQTGLIRAITSRTQHRSAAPPSRFPASRPTPAPRTTKG